MFCLFYPIGIKPETPQTEPATRPSRRRSPISKLSLRETAAEFFQFEQFFGSPDFSVADFAASIFAASDDPVRFVFDPSIF